MAQQQFPGKRYHMHNPALTAVRADAPEFEKLAQHMGGLIKDAKGPVTLFVPLKGFHTTTEPKAICTIRLCPPCLLQPLKKRCRKVFQWWSSTTTSTMRRLQMPSLSR